MSLSNTSNPKMRPVEGDGTAQYEGFFLDPETNVPPSFPIDALPSVVGDYIRALTEAGFCPNYLAGAGLFAGAVAIGNAHKIRLRPTDKPLNVSLFIPLIGDSASGKSPALAKMLGPLADKDRRAYREYKLKAAIDPDVSEPANLLVSNATLEALIRDLTVSTGGVGLNTDELISFTASANQYRKGSDLANYLTLLDGTDYHCSRKTQKKIYIENPFLSIIGGLQPVRLPKFYDGDNLESGFFYRALNVYGGVLRGHLKLGEHPETTQAETNYNATLANLCDLRENPETIWTYAPEALDLFKEYHDSISDRQSASEISKMEFAVRSKTDLLFHKYALLYELLSRVSTGGGTNGDFVFDPIVNKAAAAAAVKLVHYAVETAIFTRAILAARAMQTITKPGSKEKEIKALKLYEALPAEFETKEAVVIGAVLGISESTVKRYLKDETKYNNLAHGKIGKRS